MSQSHLLLTKLQIPQLPVSLIPRERITQKLIKSVTAKLTLVVAPAGFGKTTSVLEWVETIHQTVAWVSLDEDENNFPHFFNYLVHAFQKVAPTMGTTALELLNSGHSPQAKNVLTLLINDLAQYEAPLFLVLDDFHYLKEASLISIIDYFIQNQPPNFHVIITSRKQPQLSLSKLRSKAQLVEVTSADLRFTAAESEQFFSQTMQLELTEANRVSLEMKVEGWIAGLQLAGISLQSESDTESFISSFAGSNRHISEFLIDEVLAHLSKQQSEFLLKTSILHRLNSDLCDYLLQSQQSAEVLEQLYRSQIFTIPLDHQKHWYRYHALFVEFLQQQLSQRPAEEVKTLHQRASSWFEQQSDWHSAIQHSLQAQDYEHMLVLLEKAFEQGDWVHQNMHQFLEWYEAIPEGLVCNKLALSLSIAWLMMEVLADPWERIERLLMTVENSLADPKEALKIEESRAKTMLAEVELLRANHARALKDHEAAIQHCENALAQLPVEADFHRSGILAHLGSAYENQGNTDQALELFQAAFELCPKADNNDGLLFTANQWIALLTKKGALKKAVEVYQHLKPLLETRNGPDVGMIYVQIGEVFRQQQRWQEAQTHLEKGLALCRPFEAWQEAVTIAETSLGKLLMDQRHQTAAAQQAKGPYLPGGALTKRELTALQLFATDRSMEAIALEMFISVSSVRTYAKRIYSKLDVHSRAEAVYKATELGLL